MTYFNPPEDETVKSTIVHMSSLGRMKRVIATTLSDTYNISKLIKADTQKKTYQNILEFCFQHVEFEKDKAGKETSKANK